MSDYYKAFHVSNYYQVCQVMAHQMSDCYKACQVSDCQTRGFSPQACQFLKSLSDLICLKKCWQAQIIASACEDDHLSGVSLMESLAFLGPLISCWLAALVYFVALMVFSCLLLRILMLLIIQPP